MNATVVDNWLRSYEQAQADVSKLKHQYLAKTRRADEAEDELIHLHDIFTSILMTFPVALSLPLITMVQVISSPTHLVSDLQTVHLFNERPAFRNALHNALRKSKKRVLPLLPRMTPIPRRNPQARNSFPKSTRVKVKK